MYSSILVLLSLTVFFNNGFASVSDTIASGVVVNKVQATLDLTTHIAKYSAAVTVENSGSGDQKSFLIAIHGNFSKQLSFLGASVSTKEGDSKLTVKETAVSTHKDKHFYRVELKEALGAGKQVTVQVQAIFPHSLRPYPSHITQSEKQYVEYIGSALFYSPYKTVSQTLTVKCASTNIIAHTKVAPSTSSESSITYGPYENKEAFSEAPIVIHYENNSPFLAVTSMTRLIEVSHWGNVAVEETMDVRHTGAVLKGPFSRYDYQRGQDSTSSVKSFKMILPASARDVYYRDEIGNISTSHLLELEDSVEVELRPRFPLFGGWKTHYTLGYNVPSYQYLYHTDDHFVLKMRFVDHIFDDQVVDDITLRVILPEGAKHIRLVTPFDVERRDNEQHYTYLDTVGRPVVIAHKNNLVEQHITDFELHYTFPRVMMLQEPLLLIGAFYLLFLVVIVYVRLDFAITKDEVGESRMMVASLVEQVLNTQVRRSALYQSYEDCVNKFKASKDSNSFVNQRKKIDTDHKQLTQQIGTLLAKLKTEGSDAADKVASLQSLDQQLKELVTTQAQSAEKLVAGKVTKQQYTEADKVVDGKKKELADKIEAVQQQLS